MVYYKNDGTIVSDITEENLIGKGTTSKIYLLDNDKCLKLYNETTSKKINKDIFDLLKIYKLDNFYTLIDLVYDEAKNNVGYISKYYKSSENNLLLMPTDYIIDNYARMYYSIMMLTNNNVKVKDLYYCNVVVGDEQMTIIDADNYVFEESDYELLKYSNLKYLTYTMTGLFQENAAMLGKEYRMSSKVYDAINMIFCDDKLTPDVLSKKLTPYKRGIDLIRR